MIKNLITILGLLLLIAFGYYLVVLEDQGVQTGNQQVVSSSQLETEEFLQRLTAIQNVDLKTDVLDDPRFTNRIDYQTPVPVVPVGRSNPFVPSLGN